ncbi:DUF4393 domain-containing protein [Pseudomonas sp. CDFA 602]|uniref:Abi-alpha family protein n=1 Tax=Pseudomonas californiensis TaxID=2829823 RepID=UPI001E3DBBC0|nr:Abi-alpha family protein [Pseudomonas californiensis]MCD5996515.1 DUF4393 domain-containing protein [Pseudomonas californiensis]MCD6002114.1 DUF4393 domain-containing protein [Pseudomonas californiensis]
MVIPEISAELTLDATELAGEIYTDAAKSTVIELSKIGVDAAKTFRLALLPLQLLAAVQDKLSGHIKNAIEKVPQERRVSPRPSVVLPILEKLRYQDEGDLLTDMYLELLSRSFDSDRCGEAHPAFLNLISQLSADEVVLLNMFATSEFRILFKGAPIGWAITTTNLEEEAGKGRINPEFESWIRERLLQTDLLGLPEYLHIYVEHMVSLGLLAYTSDAYEDLNFHLRRTGMTAGSDCWPMVVSKFGALFHSACVRDALAPEIKLDDSDRI